MIYFYCLIVNNSFDYICNYKVLFIEKDFDYSNRSLCFAIRERGIEFADQTGQTKANGAFDRDP